MTRPTRDRLAIELPAPTAWPMVLAFGVTLIFAGLVTNVSVSVVGVVLVARRRVGWFREVLPHEHEEAVPRRADDARGHDRAARGRAARARAEQAARAGCRSRSIRSRRASRAGWPAASRWRCWPVPTALLRPAASGIPINLLAAGRLRAVGEARTRGACRLPSPTASLIAVVIHGLVVHARRPALRRDAADVPAAADPARRAHRAAAVDGPAALVLGLLTRC